MADRSQSATARRSRQAYALRQPPLLCAFSRVIASGPVLAMLVERRFLPNRDDNTDVEIEVALTRFIFAEAGDKNFPRVATIMRERWHSARNMEC